jgi:hypothetical protein
MVTHVQRPKPAYLDDDGSQAPLQLTDDHPEGIEVLIKLPGVSVHHVVLDTLQTRSQGMAQASCYEAESI